MKEIEKNKKIFENIKDDYDYNNLYNIYGYKINTINDILIFLKEKNENFYNHILNSEKLSSKNPKMICKVKKIKMKEMVQTNNFFYPNPKNTHQQLIVQKEVIEITEDNVESFIQNFHKAKNTTKVYISLLHTLVFLKKI